MRTIFNLILPIFMLAAIAATPSLLFSQSPPVLKTSFDIPVDPQIVGLGESVVAANGLRGAFVSNPATAAGISGYTAFYGFRNLDYYPPAQSQYTNWSILAPTSFGTLFASFEREEMPELLLTSPGYPLGYGKASLYDYAALIGFARPIGRSWNAGITMKVFNSGVDSKASAGTLEYDTKPPVMLDAGMLCHLPGLISNSTIAADEVLFGVSLQNFGTDFRISSTIVTPDGFSSTQEWYNPVPRNLRIGVCYSVSLHGSEPGSRGPFHFMITGEYRNVLNQPESSSSERDIWGFGMEATTFDILSLRVGGFVPPFRGIYGNKGVPSVRYGFGLTVPFSTVGLKLPTALQFDYAAIPVAYNAFSSFGLFTNTTMRAYSLSLTYSPGSGLSSQE